MFHRGFHKRLLVTTISLCHPFLSRLIPSYPVKKKILFRRPFPFSHCHSEMWNAQRLTSRTDLRITAEAEAVKPFSRFLFHSFDYGFFLSLCALCSRSLSHPLPILFPPLAHTSRVPRTQFPHVWVMENVMPSSLFQAKHPLPLPPFYLNLLSLACSLCF